MSAQHPHHHVPPPLPQPDGSTLTQKQLAAMISLPAAVINQYESGQAIPNGEVLSKIERALGVRLPRPAKK